MPPTRNLKPVARCLLGNKRNAIHRSRRRPPVRLQARLPREAAGDRNPEAHEANLYDVDAKYGDVVPVQEVLNYLRTGGAAQRPRGEGLAFAT